MDGGCVRQRLYPAQFLPLASLIGQQKAAIRHRPNGTDVSQFSQEQLDEVAMRLNQRPRKTLDYATPAHVFAQSVAPTG